MNTQPEAYEVPLHERLDTVPHNARLIIEDENGLGTTYIPIGREAKLAVAELRRLHELNKELVEALEELLRVEATHDDGEIILEVARHNARAALAKARGME